jgi:WD40 repeat protein
VLVRDLRNGATQTMPVSSQPMRIAFDTAADELLVASSDALRIVAPAAVNSVRTIHLPEAPIDAVISADGSRVATSHSDGTTAVWDVSSGSRFANYPRNPVTAGGQPNPVVLHVALSANGKVLATGDSNGVVMLRDTITDKVIGSQTLIVSPLPDAPTYPVAELAFVDADKALLAVNYPQPQAGDYQPPGVALFVDTATGHVTDQLGAPSKPGAPYNPGLGVSDDGQYVLTGVEGFAPSGQAQGPDAVYSVSGGDKLADLSDIVGRVPVYGYVEPNLTVSRPWSPDHTRLVTGATGVFACDACGSLKQLQAIAAQRIAWRTAIGPSDPPPAGHPLD